MNAKSRMETKQVYLTNNTNSLFRFRVIRQTTNIPVTTTPPAASLHPIRIIRGFALEDPEPAGFPPRRTQEGE